MALFLLMSYLSNLLYYFIRQKPQFRTGPKNGVRSGGVKAVWVSEKQKCFDLNEDLLATVYALEIRLSDS